MVAYNSDSRYLNFLPGNAREMVNKLTRACAGWMILEKLKKNKMFKISASNSYYMVLLFSLA